MGTKMISFAPMEEPEMQRNVGGIDRILRIAVGLGLIAYAVIAAVPLAWIGVVPLATGLIGWCPAYLPFGLKTCKTCKTEKSA
jgi:hypothetical protein